MAWWRRLFGVKAADASVSDPLRLWLEVYGSTAAKSGVSVNVNTAIQTAAVFACARVAAEDTATLPLDFVRKINGRREPLDDHPLAELLDVQANDWQTALEFRETMQWHVELCGRGVAWKNVVGGRVVELIPFLPQQIVVEASKTFGDPPRFVFIRADGTRTVIPREQIFCINGPSWDGIQGLDCVKVAREAIGLAIATENHVARLHSNGARPSGILSTEQSLAPEKVKEIREAWDAAMSGPDNAFKTAVVTGGMKWLQLAMTGVDAQTIEQRRMQVIEVCRFMRINPQMVWADDKAPTYASAEQFFLAHVKYSVLPRTRRIEAAIRRDLLGKDERNIQPKHNLAALERADIKTRYFAHGQAIKDGWKTRNEARGDEDLNPLEGLDVPLQPLNMGDGSKPPADPNADATGGQNGAA